MIFGAEIGLAIAGLVALFRGRLTISKTKVVVGIPARLLGLFALTPLPLALLLTTIYVASHVNAANPAAAQQFAQENRGTITLIEGLTVAAVAVVLFTLGALAAVHPDDVNPKARRRRDADYDDYEDEDEMLRRAFRRRNNLEAEDDRPRRRRRDDDDEDDRPRRKRDDLDERAR